MKKDRRECNNMLLRIKEEITNATVVEEKTNEYANEVEITMEGRKGEEQHQQTKIENVLVRIDKFNFPIDFVILGKEEDKQVVSTKKPSNALSRAWIDTENGEMTLLVGKEKVKFNLHQSIQLTNEERNSFMLIESSLQHFKGQAPDFLQEETLEGIELNTNSMSTKDLELELKFLNLDVRKSSSEQMRIKKQQWPQKMKG